MAGLSIRLGVIADAARRQRRRRLALLALAAVAAATVIVAIRSESTPPSTTAIEAAGPAFVPAHRLLARPPYMGVSCPLPNSIACDRLGLTIWLRRPATNVTGTINGQTMRLDDPRWSGPATDGSRRRFAGFLQPAHLGQLIPRSAASGHRWFGERAPAVRVVIHAQTATGPRTTRISVPLAPGWG